MAKLKTKKGISKRFKITKKGRVKYRAGGKSHLLSSKKKTKIRRLRRAKVLSDKKQVKYIKRLLPYA